MFCGVVFIQNNRNKRKVSWYYIHLPSLVFILPVVFLDMPGIAISYKNLVYFLPQKFCEFYFQPVRQGEFNLCRFTASNPGAFSHSDNYRRFRIFYGYVL